MAISITLYSTSSDTVTVTKTLTGGTNFSCTLRGECSILQPVIMLEASSLTGFNYAYIPEFNRYYYINNVDIIRTGLWRVSMSVDVLMSYASSIRGLKATVLRQENKFNGYIQDNKYKLLAHDNVVTKEFPEAFDEWSYILVTNGPGGEY